MHSLYVVQIVDPKTGQMLDTAPMGSHEEAKRWIESYLRLLPEGKAHRFGRIWQHPQDRSNKGGAQNKVVWDSRFGNQ